MSSPAARKKLLRQRQRQGICVVPVEVDVDDVAMLARVGLVDRMADHYERVDIGAGISRLLKIIRDASR